MPSAKASKTKAQSKKPGKGQLLISRFFGSKPKPTAAATSKSPTVPRPTPTVQQIPSEPFRVHEKVDNPERPPPASTPDNLPHVEIQKETVLSQGPGTPATLADTPQQGEELPLSSSPEQSTKTEPASGRRKRRRLFVFQEEDDSDASEGCNETLARKKARKPVADKDPDFSADADPDFAVDADSEEDSGLHGSSAVDSDEEMLENGESDTERQPESPKVKVMESRTTLESYGNGRRTTTITKELPRDEKRRIRFTQKMGRLEKNSFFLRRTGGGGDVVETRAVAGRHKKATKYTPLEAQYVEMHRKHPDKLLVVECGYKYRMFDADASVASKVLRVAAYFDHNFLTASFPTHRLSHHVRRFVQAGYKVGVVSQSETAALKKASDKSSKLFQRKLTSVYTKGTIAADGKLLTPEQQGGKGLTSSASYIMAILEFDKDQKDNFGLQAENIAMAAVDSATGEVLFDSFIDDVLRSDLESRLVALEPVEVLTSKEKLSKQTALVVKSYCENMSARLERVKSSSFERNDALSKLNDIVEGRHPDGKPALEASLSCLGALAEYLKQFQLELCMSTAIEFKSFRSRREMKIGADVLHNFEVFGNSNDGSTEGSLIGLLNRTRTPFGSRQMRQWVSHPLVHSQDIVNRLDAVEYLRTKVDGYEHTGAEDDVLANAVIDLITSFSGIPDLEQGLTRISCHKCTPSEFLAVVQAFEGVGRKIDDIKSMDKVTALPSLLAKLFSSTPMVGTILNGCIIESLNRVAAADDAHHELFSHDRPLPCGLRECESAEKFLDLVRELEATNNDVHASERAMDILLRKLRKSHSFPKWEWKKVANEEFLLEVPVSKASSVPHSWPIVCQTKVVKRFRPPEATRGFEKVQCSRETRDGVSSRCWRTYLELFATVATPLRAVVRTLIELDCLSALARVSNLPGYAKPRIITDENIPAGIQARGARHPLTEALQTCKSYVPNDVNLGRGCDEIALVISGPNYGGKSSYARMTALLVIMAQVGSYVPAEKVDVSPFDSIHARMGSSDAIAKGMSSLMVELAETSRILSTATSRSLVVLDELGRGTSTHDGTAIAYATLAHLVGQVQCVSLFVTHYPTLATLRNRYPKLVGAYYMDYLELVSGGDNNTTESDEGSECNRTGTKRAQITFLYKLAKGVASSSYGLNVARLAGIPLDVIEQAGQKALELEQKLQEPKDDFVFRQCVQNETWAQTDMTKEAVASIVADIS